MSSNLINATREALDRSWRSAVSYGMPLLTRLREREQFVAGGDRYEQIFESADYEDLVQEYGANDGLRAGSKDILQKPHWHVAYLQCPVEENVDESVMNAHPGEHQLIALRDKIGRAALQGVKARIAQRIYGCAVDNEFNDENTMVQGLCSALNPPLGASAVTGSTYGGIARTTVANLAWAPADYANTFTQYAINKKNIDDWMDSVLEYAGDGNQSDLLILMGTSIFNRLRSIFEAQNCYQPKGDKAKQGFEAMEYNGVEIAKDMLLERMTSTGRKRQSGTSNGYITHNTAVTYAGASTSAGLCGDATYNGESDFAGNTFVFVLNLSTWHLRYFERFGEDGSAVEGPFHMTEFFDQSKVANGKEIKLARVKWRGNLTCDMPNRNLMRANVR